MTETCALQDHILPYILGERHVEDTLFIVVEEEFRFFDDGARGAHRPRAEAESIASLSAVSFGASSGSQIPGGCTRRPQKVSSLKQQWATGRSMPAAASQAMPPEIPHGGLGLSNQEWPLWRHTTFRGSCGAG